MTPLQLHPQNRHYFLFRGQPTVLVTAGEHYGAVLNADFDAVTYLDALAADGLNHTRIFVGAYCEPQGAFRIARNTLAPAPGRLLAPWARSEGAGRANGAGYANGGNRFDLMRWDAAFFERLRSFLAAAGARDVVVEVNLFCPFYREEMWDLSPMKATNNINGIGDVAREDVYTLDRSGGLPAVQEAMTRKVVDELRDCDNLFYEIMNEPYQRDVPLAWQTHIVDVIRAAEGDAAPHLISLNVANGRQDAREAFAGSPPAGISLLNFHYAWPPDTVALNHDLGLAIGDNETGFSGQGDFAYRREGWAFLLAGGALFNHLDYSFAVGHEDGSFRYPDNQPGGGSKALRVSLGALKRFVDSRQFVRMAPIPAADLGGLPEDVAAFGLAEPGRQLAVYLCRTQAGSDDGPQPQTETTAADAPSKDASPAVSLPFAAGRYHVEWVRPLDGAVLDALDIEHDGGKWTLEAPAFAEDVALRATPARR